MSLVTEYHYCYTALCSQAVAMTLRCEFLSHWTRAYQLGGGMPDFVAKHRNCVDEAAGQMEASEIVAPNCTQGVSLRI